MPLKAGARIAAPTPVYTPTSSGATGRMQPVVWPPGRSGVLAMTWTGANGETWDLMGGKDALFVCEGMTGIGGMTQTEYTSEAAESDGQFYRAGRFGARQVFWPTLIWNDDDPAGDFTSYMERWNNSLSYHQQGVWTVTDARSISRSLHLRLVDPGDDFDRDPARKGWALMSTKLVADQPHWEGEWAPRFFGTDGQIHTMFEKAPKKIIRLTSGNTLSRAKITNPGQVEAWPVWTVYGPCDSASVGIGQNVVTVPFRLNNGDVFRLDTRGGKFQAWLYSGPAGSAPDWDQAVDVVQRLSAWDAVPIPPGTDLPLNITVSGGTGLVQCDLTPLYYRGVA